MIDNYLLEGLVAFAKAAAELSVTQPALTRSMVNYSAINDRAFGNTE
jgi:hypothetical protein